MSKNILFFPDLYQEHGHWLPVVALARRLKFSVSGRVAFMGIPDCESIVTSNDGEYDSKKLEFHRVFTEEYPEGYTKSRQNELIKDRGRFPQLWNIMDGGLDGLMQNVNPSLIVSGYFTALEMLLMYYRYGIDSDKKFMITTTYLRHPDAPPHTFMADWPQ
ncbi:MAG: hypothetical protein LBI42_09500 [Chitinispirillales bacterium]|jgi:hypothetical protein|nr:hypothetical protein [Chitinispirillales bacterium]